MVQIKPFFIIFLNHFLLFLLFLSFILSILVQNDKFIDMYRFKTIYQPSFYTICTSIKGKPPLSTGRFGKMSEKRLVIHRFGFGSILLQEFDHLGDGGNNQIALVTEVSCLD